MNKSNTIIPQTAVAMSLSQVVNLWTDQNEVDGKFVNSNLSENGRNILETPIQQSMTSMRTELQKCKSEREAAEEEEEEEEEKLSGLTDGKKNENYVYDQVAHALDGRNYGC